jgi:hypothetical protein
MYPRGRAVGSGDGDEMTALPVEFQHDVSSCDSGRSHTVKPYAVDDDIVAFRQPALDHSLNLLPSTTRRVILGRANPSPLLWPLGRRRR